MRSKPVMVMLLRRPDITTQVIVRYILFHGMLYVFPDGAPLVVSIRA